MRPHKIIKTARGYFIYPVEFSVQEIKSLEDLVFLATIKDLYDYIDILEAKEAADAVK